MLSLRSQLHLVNKCAVNFCFYRSVSNNYHLTEVGKFLDIKTDQYDTGQLIFHKIFGYRGIILFPWQILVTDKDEIKNLKNDEPMTRKGTLEYLKAIKTQGKMQTYYQVLIDSGDCQHIKAQTEGITYLGGSHEGGQSLYNIPGLDYVAHEDIFPYSTTDKKPIRHDLFDQFLSYSSDKEPLFVGKDRLKEWKDRNNWLDLSYVQKQTTENIKVTVIPYYMGCRSSQATNVYWWRCCIRLEHLGHLEVQLRERNWRIFTNTGLMETIRGPGVGGQKPKLSISQPAFQFYQHVSLQSPSGHMIGALRMERSDGYTFDCKIPSFTLDSASDKAESL